MKRAAGSRRARPPSARTAAAVVALGLLVSAAACGGSSHGTATQQQSGALAFAQCMRTNGVATYPDPGSDGQLVKEPLGRLGVSSARFAAAQSACRHLLPNGGAAPTPAEVQQVRTLSLKFAECVRAHGVPGFPDPDSTGRIPDPGSVGINQGSPKFEAANNACARYRPPYMPSNAAYNAWARAHG
jgi:hypothetical protein